MKRGPKPKYKTDKQRREAKLAQMREAARRYRKANPSYAHEYYLKIKEARKKLKENSVQETDTSEIALLKKDILELKTEIKELKLDFEEVLKDNKKLSDLVRWGK